jgi:threonine dehydratase
MSLLPPKPTTFVQPATLCRELGLDVTIAVEAFQYTGSFKYRATYNLVQSIDHPSVIAASSGNFGQAMAFACEQAGKPCTIVMPNTSSKVKVDAVRSYGAIADLIDTSQITREARVAQLAENAPEAYIASAYDDPLVIAGNASLGREIAASGVVYDFVLAPVGGGGLASGLIQAFRETRYSARVVGAEPALGNDAARTLAAGSIQVNDREPPTLADGARTRSIGRHNWAVLKDGIDSIIEVTEDQIREAVKLHFLKSNIKAEPTGCLTLGALLASPDRFRTSKILCVVSGGNVEPGLYASLIQD